MTLRQTLLTRTLEARGWAWSSGVSRDQNWTLILKEQFSYIAENSGPRKRFQETGRVGYIWVILWKRNFHPISTHVFVQQTFIGDFLHKKFPLEVGLQRKTEKSNDVHAPLWAWARLYSKDAHAPWWAGARLSSNDAHALWWSGTRLYSKDAHAP